MPPDPKTGTATSEIPAWYSHRDTATRVSLMLARAWRSRRLGRRPLEYYDFFVCATTASLVFQSVKNWVTFRLKSVVRSIMDQWPQWE
jgi:hypothetical protein